MSEITMQEALTRCIERRELSHDEMVSVFQRIMQGEVPPVLIGAFAIALRVKGETTGEIAAAARVMKDVSLKVPVKNPENLIDIVGTGGDGARTFNISTCAMFAAAACGAKVAKHGARSVSSSSGSADLLERLGINIALEPADVARAVEETGMGFMFAPRHHMAMKYAKPVREELGVRTVFNILGPLTNPANAGRILMGVFAPGLVGPLADVLKKLGLVRAMVVWGKDNLDEISLGAPTMVGELKDGTVREYEIKPEDFGLKRCDTANFKVDGPEASKRIILDVLGGKPGPESDIVALNAGAALYTADAAGSIAEGLEMAQAAIASGAALKKLEEYAAFAQAAKP